MNLRRLSVTLLSCICVMIILFNTGSHAAALSVSDAVEFKSAIVSSSDATLVLQNDLNLTHLELGPQLKLVNSANITIDLNGHNITFSEIINIDTSTAMLTIKNGTISTTGDNNVLSVGDSGILYLENVTANFVGTSMIYMEDNSKLYLNGSTLVRNDGGAIVEIAPDSRFMVYGSDGTPITDISGSIYQPYNPDFNISNSGGNDTPDKDDTGNISTDISVTVEGIYSVVVPKSIDFGTLTYTTDESTRYVVRTGDINVEYFISDEGSILEVSVYGIGANGAFELKNEAGVSLPYDVKNSNGDVLTPNGKVAEFTGAGSKSFSVQIDRSQIKHSGKYSGKLNFDITIK